MTAFEFQVVWDPAMMELVSHDFLADDKGWQIDKDAVKEGEGQYQCLTHAISAGSWDIDAKWLTLEFHSLAEGSTTIHALDLYTGTGTVWLSDGVTTQTVPFDSDEITVNQHQPGPPAGPSGYVGGEVFSANKLAVLSPYLALISIVAVAAVLVKRRKP
jgi:hypothetical protein